MKEQCLGTNGWLQWNYEYGNNKHCFTYMPRSCSHCY